MEWQKQRCTSRPAQPAQPPEIVHFESEKLSAGEAKRCESGGGTPLVSYGMPRSPILRIVDPETMHRVSGGNDR